MELITQAEFARRKNVSKQAVQKSIGKRIQAHANGKMIDWDSQSDIWDGNAKQVRLTNNLVGHPQKALHKQPINAPEIRPQPRRVTPAYTPRAPKNEEPQSIPKMEVPRYIETPDLPPKSENADKDRLRKQQETQVQARTAKEVYDAKFSQLKYEQAAGILINAEEAKLAWTKLLTAARNKILGIPASCKSKQSDLPFSVLSVIESVCRQTLEDLADGVD